MMQFKPGGGYTPKGHFNPKKQIMLTLASAILFFGSLFVLTALVFGWWSILVDACIIGFLQQWGKSIKKNRLDNGA